MIYCSCCNMHLGGQLQHTPACPPGRPAPTPSALHSSHCPPPPRSTPQGSDNIDHWRVNLTFDPVPFEGGALGGARVHRGVYEAAQQVGAWRLLQLGLPCLALASVQSWIGRPRRLRVHFADLLFGVCLPPLQL